MTILLQITSPHRVDHTFTSSASHAYGNYASDDVFTSFEADIPCFMAKVGSFKKKKKILNIRKMIISVFFHRF